MMTMNMLRQLCYVVLLMSLSVGAYAQEGKGISMNDDLLITELSIMLDDLTARDEFSGSVLLLHDGEIIFEGFYGYANRETESDIDRDTLFGLASMNKMMTSVAIAQLVEAGLVDFDAPVGLYLDDLPTEIGDKVTVHHLLTHTSGLVDMFMSPLWPDYIDSTDTVRGYFPLFIDVPLSFPPGERFEYSNSNFVMLGAIIEAVSGEPYFDTVREHIYEPAGMVRSDSYPRDAMPDNVAIGYTIMTDNHRPGNTLRPNTSFEHAMPSPAGGGYGTAHELALFATALFDGTLLNPATAALITAPKVDVPIPGMNMRYAYGFEIKASGSIGHTGGFPGVSSSMGIFPDAGYTYVVLSNTDMGGRTIMMQLEALFEQMLNA